MTNPTFTQLIDWVDGRLGADRAAEVQRAVAGSTELAGLVEWIESFRSAGRSMPLAAPPADVSADLRSAFRRRLGITDGPADHEARTTLDSRLLGLASGTRSTAAEALDHVVLESAGTTVTLAVVPRSATAVDVQGLVSTDTTGTRPEIVLDGPDPRHRRTVRPDRDGRFRLDEVDRSIDQVWVLIGDVRIHGVITLGPST